jgi:hypothetical protein
LTRLLSAVIDKLPPFGTHPAVIAMLAALIEQRQSAPDLPLCAPDCCPAPKRVA